MFVTQPTIQDFCLGYKSDKTGNELDRRRSMTSVKREAGVRSLDVFECFRDVVRTVERCENYAWNFLDSTSEASQERGLDLGTTENYMSYTNFIKYAKRRQTAGDTAGEPAIYGCKEWHYLEDSDTIDEGIYPLRKLEKTTSLRGHERAEARPRRKRVAAAAVAAGEGADQ